MPKQPGFEKRIDLYLLYHYLNHYNLFGSGYRSSAMSIIDDYLRMLKPHIHYPILRKVIFHIPRVQKQTPEKLPRPQGHICLT
ncbi:Fructosamine/Ketosamine-3-kinase - like 2 [Theobroma cacao]|nr:Fructosamine/Ketosamine-3-kinase - like 2 [Theobroma cacao]